MCCSGQLIHCLIILGNKNNLRTIWGWNRPKIKKSPASAESWAWFPYDLLRSVTVGDRLRSMSRKYHTRVFPCNCWRSQTRNPISLSQPEAQAKIAANFFLNSNWAVTDTCFKRNNVMSPIAADHTRQAFPLKSVVVGEIVMVGKVEPSSTLPITQIVRRRPSQTQCRVFPYDL